MTAKPSKAGRPACLDFNEPGSVTTLRKTYRQRLRLPELQTFIQELVGESDRAAIILASSLLDDLLANAIALKMPFKILVEDVDTIFKSSSPLGSFSSRTEIACLFGIIEAETFRQLMILREMRNACAHSKHKLDFQTPVLANVALHFFKGGRTPEALIRKSMKFAFCSEVAFLAVVLSHGSREAANKLYGTTISELSAQRSSSHGKPPAR